MKITSRDNDNYYPQPESQGGWRFLKDKREIKNLTNVSLGKLDDLIQRYRLFFDTHASGIVVIRNGYLIREHYSFMTLPGVVLIFGPVQSHLQELLGVYCWKRLARAHYPTI